MNARHAVPLALTVFVALASACSLGEGEKRGALPTYTPAAWILSPTATPLVFPVDMADSITHAALPPAGVLGPGWKATERDDFSSSNRLEGAPECAALKAISTAAEHQVGKPAARAKQEYATPQIPGVLKTTAEIEVEVFEDAATVAAAVEAMDALFNADQFAACMGAAFQSGFGAPIDVTSNHRASRVAAQDGWATAGIEITAKVDGNPLTLRMDFYGIPFGNMVATVMVFGTSTDVAEELIHPVLDALSTGVGKLAADPTASPYGVLADAANANFTPDDFPSDAVQPIGDYVGDFCAASTWWLERLKSTRSPDLEGTVSDTRAAYASFLNGLRDGMDMYIQRVIDAGYPDSTEGRMLAADIVGVLQWARSYYDDAANRVEGFSSDPGEFNRQMTDLELDLRKGALQIVQGWVRISGEYDVSAFAAAIAATPGCKAPWDEGGPSGAF